MLLERYKDAKAASQRGPAVRAAELLGKRLGLFTDRVFVTEVESLSDEQLVERISDGDPHRVELARALIGPSSFGSRSTKH